MEQTCHYRSLQTSDKEPTSDLFDRETLPQRTMDDDTTRSNPRAASSGTTKTGHRYMQVLTRTLWLQALKQALPGSNSNEQPKVAVFEESIVGLIHAILHLIPLGGAATLVILNAKTTAFYNYEYDPTWSTAIQFAAKFLEVLVQTSLADIYLGYIRHQVVGSDGLPLGALFGPLQTTHITYLWSLDFWASLTARHLRLPRRVLLFLVTFTIVSLAALVGPSSAVAMIPRPLTVRSGTSWVFFDTLESLFTRQVGLSHVQYAKFGQGLLMDMWSSIHSDLTWLPSRESWDVVDEWGARAAYTQPVSKVMDGHEYDAVATIPLGMLSFTLANEIRQNGQRDDALTTSFYQPVVRVECLETFLSGSGTKWIPFPRESEEPELSQLVTYSEFIEEIDYATSRSAFAMAAPASSRQHSSLLISAFKPDHTTNVSQNPWTFRTCTVDASWIKADYNFTENTGVTNVNVRKMFEDERLGNSLSGHILLDPEFVEYVILYLDDAEYWTTDEQYYAGHSYISPNLLALVLAWALSVVAPENAELVNNIPGPSSVQSNSVREYLQHNLHLDSNYVDFWIADGWDGTNIANFMRIDIHHMRNAYGYSLKSTTVILSVVVLFIYCIIAILHIIGSGIRGSVGSSWDTVSELFMLALNTQPPSHISNTSAGVNTFGTFREPVKIKANTHGSLEVVFLDDPAHSSDDFEEIKPNEAY